MDRGLEDCDHGNRGLGAHDLGKHEPRAHDQGVYDRRADGCGHHGCDHHGKNNDPKRQPHWVHDRPDNHDPIRRGNDRGPNDHAPNDRGAKHDLDVGDAHARETSHHGPSRHEFQATEKPKKASPTGQMWR